jgi:hypothetical protein
MRVALYVGELVADIKKVPQFVKVIRKVSPTAAEYVCPFRFCAPQVATV